jgi:hypothetical protein
MGKVAKAARFAGDTHVAQYANMFRYSITGFLASGAFLGRAYFDYAFTIFACMIILQNVFASEAEFSPAPALDALPELS